MSKMQMMQARSIGEPIAIYAQDDAATPRETTLAKLPWFPDQFFQFRGRPEARLNPRSTTRVVSSVSGCRCWSCWSCTWDSLECLPSMRRAKRW